MKRTSTATGSLTLAALLLLGVAFAGSASAQVFLWIGPLPALVLILSQNKQILTGAGADITCEHFSGHGIISNGKAMTAKEFTLTGVFTSCLIGGVIPLTLSPVEYLLDAGGSIGQVNKAVVATIPALNCSLKFSSGPPNSTLKTVKLLNRPEDILAHLELTKIASLGSGGECGAAGVEKTEGTFRGLWLVFIDGGTIKWDP